MLHDLTDSQISDFWPLKQTGQFAFHEIQNFYGDDAHNSCTTFSRAHHTDRILIELIHYLCFIFHTPRFVSSKIQTTSVTERAATISFLRRIFVVTGQRGTSSKRSENSLNFPPIIFILLSSVNQTGHGFFSP